MDVNEQKTKLIGFIKKEFILEGGTDITPETPLLSSGIIDSFSLVSLQRYIEKEFGVRVPPSKLNVEKANTVTQMVALIQAK